MGDAATNDLALVVAVQAGDADAFGVLVTRHTPALLRLVARAVGDADDAEDVVQETFLQAYRALHTFRVLARSARRCSRTWRRASMSRTRWRGVKRMVRSTRTLWTAWTA